MSGFSPIGGPRFVATPDVSATTATTATTAASSAGFRGFPAPRGASSSSPAHDVSGGAWMASDGPRRPASIVLEDRGGGLDGHVSIAITSILGGRPGPNEGIVEGLVNRVGKEAAKDAGLREARNLGNLFGAAPGRDYRVPVEVDVRLKPRDFADLPPDAILHFPLPEAIADALEARGDGYSASTSGIGITTGGDGTVYLSVPKYAIRKTDGLF